jgi:hypothetical protein
MRLFQSGLFRVFVFTFGAVAGATRSSMAQEAPPPPPPEAPAPSPPEEPVAAAPSGGGSQATNYFNPSVSVIGNFLAVGGHNKSENLPNASLRESELGLQAIVDPYARADFFLSFGEEGVGVEEGFLTFTALPAGLQAKIGRMRVAFGKINTLHLHVLPWPDEPLTVVDLLGGEEGWIGTGGSLSKLIPLPGDTFSELTVQAFRGDGIFDARRRSELVYNGHYRIFKDISEATNVDFGLSYGDGPNGTTETARTRLVGADVTLRWKPLVTGSYRSAIVRGEWIRSRRAQAGGARSADGWFASAEYQLAKRWFTGVRFEGARHPDDPSVKDNGQALTLTFWPSEFSQLRGELRRRHYGATGESAKEVLLQLQFAIGAHGAHPF